MTTMPSVRLRDWILLLSLGAMWGSAFMFVKIAVATIPPATVAAARLVIGALVLILVIYVRGLRLPALSAVWRDYAVLALIGHAVPFCTISCVHQTAMLDEFLAALGEREHTTVVRYPALNHLFIAGSGVPGPADYSMAGVVDVRAVEDLAAWIGRIAPRKSGTSVARPPAAVAPVSPS